VLIITYEGLQSYSLAPPRVGNSCVGLRAGESKGHTIHPLAATIEACSYATLLKSSSPSVQVSKYIVEIAQSFGLWILRRSTSRSWVVKDSA
jgi:hypothetical protein